MKSKQVNTIQNGLESALRNVDVNGVTRALGVLKDNYERTYACLTENPDVEEYYKNNKKTFDSPPLKDTIKWKKQDGIQMIGLNLYMFYPYTSPVSKEDMDGWHAKEDFDRFQILCKKVEDLAQDSKSNLSVESEKSASNYYDKFHVYIKLNS